ncbi:CDP-alcohol phosphatidyltransferase family protein [Kushneria marisflavi]|nr:CDP-alcohol phosphatidyltransferase family protein [Kushneria marisflavi]RKD87099.1 phosphatidylglycerophosphate synthase [Kushneria marisflavi]
MSEQRIVVRQPMWPASSVLMELLAGGIGLMLLVALLHLVCGAPTLLYPVAGGVYLALSGIIVHGWPEGQQRFGWANRVTLMRAILIVLLTAMLPLPAFINEHHLMVFATALTALALDGVDGWVARRSHTESRFGARLDMELDAFFILMLCLMLVIQGKAGAWIMAIGAMRYAFVAAARVWHWLDEELPVSYRRKTICVWQVSTLMTCLLPWVTTPWSNLALALSLLLLMISFAMDTVYLYRRAAV